MFVKKAKKSKDTERGMILEQIKMTPEERLALARKIRGEQYGKRLPDVRDF
jgi:hypothetical protein